jgi:uncharacterized protein YjeT (DUF2065 family)
MPTAEEGQSTGRLGTVQEPSLERTGTKLGRSARWFLTLALILVIPGVVLVVIDHTWSLAFGAALLLLGSIPGAVGIGLIVSGVVARWSARHNSFA